MLPERALDRRSLRATAALFGRVVPGIAGEFRESHLRAPVRQKHGRKPLFSLFLPRQGQMRRSVRQGLCLGHRGELLRFPYFIFIFIIHGIFWGHIMAKTCNITGIMTKKSPKKLEIARKNGKFSKKIRKNGNFSRFFVSRRQKFVSNIARNPVFYTTKTRFFGQKYVLTTTKTSKNCGNTS